MANTFVYVVVNADFELGLRFFGKGAVFKDPVRAHAFVKSAKKIFKKNNMDPDNIEGLDLKVLCETYDANTHTLLIEKKHSENYNELVSRLKTSFGLE